MSDDLMPYVVEASGLLGAPTSDGASLVSRVRDVVAQRDALAEELTELCITNEHDNQPCWCDLPYMVPYRGHPHCEAIAKLLRDMGKLP